MRNKLDKGLLRVLLVLCLLLAGLLILAEEQGGTVQTPAVAAAEQLPCRLFSDFQDLEGKAGEDGRVTVVIKLREPSVSDVEQGIVVEELKWQAVQSQRRVLEFLDTKDATVLNTFWLINAVLAEVPVDLLEALTSMPEVEGLFENFTITIPEPPEPESLSSVPLEAYAWTWGLGKIGAPEVWDMGITGSGVRVAVLDTGVDISHPDLAGKMWTDDPDDPTYPGGWIEFDEEGNIVPGSTPHDTDGHGTVVSGAIVGGDESGTAIGVAPGARLMHGLVTSEQFIYYAQVIACMQWCIDPFDQHGNPAGEPADVINMSLGVAGYADQLLGVVREVEAKGIVFIAGIGNDGEGTSGSPGNAYDAFGIGATDANDDVVSFSSGELVDWPASHPSPYIKPDFSAPGVGVLSAVPVDYDPPSLWYYVSGTSVAAPHVAGTVALMLEVNPTLTVDEIYEALKDTAVWCDRYYDETPCTRYGWGRIDAYEAVVAATPCDLTTSSSTGGSVTAPGEGVFSYGRDTVVELKAEAEDGYRFDNWTGDVDTIDDVDAAETTITMDSSYSIIANFKEAGGCCSCNAAYGTPMAEELQILRAFRDEYLLTNPVGQTFVDFYYWVSPAIAEFITEHPSLKPIVRAVLLPAVAMSTVTVNTTPIEKIAMVGWVVLISVALVAWAKRQRDRCPQYS